MTRRGWKHLSKGLEESVKTLWNGMTKMVSVNSIREQRVLQVLSFDADRKFFRYKRPIISTEKQKEVI